MRAVRSAWVVLGCVEQACRARCQPLRDVVGHPRLRRARGARMSIACATDFALLPFNLLDGRRAPQDRCDGTRAQRRSVCAGCAQARRARIARRPARKANSARRPPIRRGPRITRAARRAHRCLKSRVGSHQERERAAGCDAFFHRLQACERQIQPSPVTIRPSNSSKPLHISQDRDTVVNEAHVARAHENDLLHEQVVWRSPRLMKRSRPNAGFFFIPSRFQLLCYRIGRIVKTSKCS
jgi:hypothetical protein